MCEKFEDIKLEDVESTFQSNIVAMIALTKFAVPHMKRGSTIVNSTSVTAFKGMSSCMPLRFRCADPSCGRCRFPRHARLLFYQGGDCGIHSLTRTPARTQGYVPFILRLGLPLTLIPGIRVNAVAPGPVFTPLQPASRPSEQMDDWEVGKLPLWGRAGMPSELAPSYVGLAFRILCVEADFPGCRSSWRRTIAT